MKGNLFLIENKVRKIFWRYRYDCGIVLHTINLSVAHPAVFCIPNYTHWSSIYNNGFCIHSRLNFRSYWYFHLLAHKRIILKYYLVIYFIPHNGTDLCFYINFTTINYFIGVFKKFLIMKVCHSLLITEY